MFSTPGTKPKLGYMQHAQSRDKPKHQTPDASVEKAKKIIGSDYSDLFSHMNKNNLDYISSQIKEKEKEKRKVQKKIEVQEKHKPTTTVQTSDINVLHVQNPIEQIDASQQQTQRSQQSHIVKRQEKASDLKVQQLQVPPSSDRVSLGQPAFIQFLDNYIQSLSQLPAPQHFSQAQSREKSPKLSHKYSVKQSIKKSNFAPKLVEIDQQKLQQAYRNLQKKFQKQKFQGSLLISQLQDCRKIQDGQKQQMMRLQEQIQILSREVERQRKRKENVVKKRDLIRNVILNDSQHNSSTSIHQRMRSRDVQFSNIELMNQQYETFKTHSQKYRR